jgi:uncharacterized protein YjbI with pentapeptide repeats
MQIRQERHGLNVMRSDLSCGNSEDVNMSGGRYRNVNLSDRGFEDVNMWGWNRHLANLSGLRGYFIAAWNKARGAV